MARLSDERLKLLRDDGNFFFPFYWRKKDLQSIFPRAKDGANGCFSCIKRFARSSDNVMEFHKSDDFITERGSERAFREG